MLPVRAAEEPPGAPEILAMHAADDLGGGAVELRVAPPDLVEPPRGLVLGGVEPSAEGTLVVAAHAVGVELLGRAPLDVVGEPVFPLGVCRDRLTEIHDSSVAEASGPHPPVTAARGQA